MNSHYFLKWVWGLGFREKNILSVLIFAVTSAIISIMVLIFDSFYPIFLLLISLVLTSGFYFRTINIIPSFLSTISLIALYIIHYGELFLITIELTLLNVLLFFILSLLISILIGHLNTSFKKLKCEKKSETKKRWDAEKRKEFLSTLLRQDLASKNQTIWGHLQLIEDKEFPEEQRKHLEKARETCSEVYETLNLTKKLENIEKDKQKTSVDLTYTVQEVIREIEKTIENKEIEIKHSLPDKQVIGETNPEIKTLIQQLIKTRIQTTELKKICIEINEKENIKIEVMDDGPKLHPDIQKLFSGDTYTGNTTGVWGVRYYMINQIARHINAEIKAKNSSEPRETRFTITLPRN